MAEAAPNLNPSVGDTAAEDFSVSMPESWRRAMVPPVDPASPASRIALIEDSQRCLTHGWLTLLPVVGAFFVIPAVRRFLSVDRERGAWNPAAHLWLRGLVLACLGYWANLIWWGLLARWLSAAMQDNRSDSPAHLQLYSLLLFASAPGFFGIGLAATRWPTRFGLFVKHRHRELFGLLLVSYATVQHRFINLPWDHYGMRHQSEGPSELFLHGSLILWLSWLLAGFACLARRGTSSWLWVTWLFGGALLGLWAAGQ